MQVIEPHTVEPAVIGAAASENTVSGDTSEWRRSPLRHCCALLTSVFDSYEDAIAWISLELLWITVCLSQLHSSALLPRMPSQCLQRATY